MSNLQIPFIGIQRQYNNLREEILDVTDQVLQSGIVVEVKQLLLVLTQKLM